jgi:hypothetical protein
MSRAWWINRPLEKIGHFTTQSVDNARIERSQKKWPWQVGPSQGREVRMRFFCRSCQSQVKLPLPCGSASARRPASVIRTLVVSTGLPAAKVRSGFAGARQARRKASR